MTAQFKESFRQDLMEISEERVCDELRTLIEHVEQSPSRDQIADLEKLTEGEHDYKIKLDDYRIGLTIHHDVVTFVRCLHRNDITNFFLTQPE